MRIVDGWFGDHVGLPKHMMDNESVSVLLNKLGRKVKVVIGLNGVEAA